MAKGQSTFRQLGKIDGRKYYQVKGVDGIVSQSINQGMSNRVKNDAAYANTRLNNAEFGGAGSTAGAITRALSQKWRYLLVPFATGKIAKDVRSIMMLDATGKWGQRGLTGTTWQALLAEKISAYSKNSVADYTGLEMDCIFNSSEGLRVTYTASSLRNEIVEAAGADGVIISFLIGKVDASAYDTTSKHYAPAVSDLQEIYSTECPWGESESQDFSRGDIKATAQVANTIYCALMVILPYKEVNGLKYIMQEHCSFKMVAAHTIA